MFDDMDWSTRGNGENCVPNGEKVKDHAMKFLQKHWTFRSPGSEEKWCGTSSYPPKGERDSTANNMVQRFKDTVHPVLESTSALKQKKG